MTALERARELVKSVPRGIALVYIDCDAVHHTPGDRHGDEVGCPAATRAIQAQIDSEALAAIAVAGLALREACPASLNGQDDDALMYMPVRSLRAFDAALSDALGGGA